MGVQQEFILVAVGFSMIFFQKLSENEIEHPERGDIELLTLRGFKVDAKMYGKFDGFP